MEMAFWQEEFIELVLVSTRFYLVIFVRLSVGLFTEMLNKQLWTWMDVCVINGDKWYTLMID